MNKINEQFAEKIAAFISEKATDYLDITEKKFSNTKVNTSVGCQEHTPSKSKYTNIERECYLKSDISKKLDGRFDDENSNRYIVSQWGGIYIKDIKSFCEKAEAFKNDLENGECSLDCISSLSKVAAFAHPDKYFIYDSRVAYSLDWLLFKSGYEGEYFPVPESQVKVVREYSIETVIRLSDKTISEKKSTKSVYLTYCELVQSIHASLIKKDSLNFGHFESKPFIVEMILYSITETLIEEMKNNISLGLKII